MSDNDAGLELKDKGKGSSDTPSINNFEGNIDNQPFSSMPTTKITQEQTAKGVVKVTTFEGDEAKGIANSDTLNPPTMSGGVGVSTQDAVSPEEYAQWLNEMTALSLCEKL